MPLFPLNYQEIEIIEITISLQRIYFWHWRHKYLSELKSNSDQEGEDLSVLKFSGRDKTTQCQFQAQTVLLLLGL